MSIKNRFINTALPNSTSLVEKLRIKLKITQQVQTKKPAKQSGINSAEYREELAEFQYETLNTFIEKHCIERVTEFCFSDSKQFFFSFKNHTEPDEHVDQTAELVLFLEDIYHLIEDDAFDTYMRRLFSAAEKYVIIYASSGEQQTNHLKHLKLTDWVDKNKADFNLLQFIPNTSFGDFYVFGSRAALASHAIFPKISILVPVFNTEQYLHKCLDSILNQSYKNIEVVCVNDCSCDNSLSILTEYAKKDGRIIIIDKHINEGLPQARKTAFINSTGEYILPVDSDDWIEDNMVERLYSCLVFGEYDMICCGYYEEKHNDEYCYFPQILPENKMEKIKYGIFGFGNSKMVWNKLAKREVYEKVKFSNESNGEDCYITCQTLYHSNRVGYYPLPLYHLSYSRTSLTANKFIAQRRYEDRKANYNHIIEFCIEKFGHDLSFFEPELEKRMSNIEKQKPKYIKNKLFSLLSILVHAKN